MGYNPKELFCMGCGYPKRMVFQRIADHQHIEWGYNLRQPCFKQQK